MAAFPWESPAINVYGDPNLARMEALRAAEMAAAERAMLQGGAGIPAAYEAAAAPSAMRTAFSQLGRAAKHPATMLAVPAWDSLSAIGTGLGEGAAEAVQNGPGAGLGQFFRGAEGAASPLLKALGWNPLRDAAIDMYTNATSKGTPAELTPDAAARIAAMQNPTPPYDYGTGAPGVPAAAPQQQRQMQQPGATASPAVQGSGARADAVPQQAGGQSPSAPANTVPTALALPEPQKDALADKIEEAIGSVDQTFQSFMESRGATAMPQGLSRGDKAALLIHFGLNMAAAGSRPGASFLDGLTGGAQGAFTGYQGIKDQRKADAALQYTQGREAFSDQRDATKLKLEGYRNLLKERNDAAREDALRKQAEASLAETRRGHDQSAQAQADASRRGWAALEQAKDRGAGAFGGGVSYNPLSDVREIADGLRREYPDMPYSQLMELATKQATAIARQFSGRIPAAQDGMLPGVAEALAQYQ